MIVGRSAEDEDADAYPDSMSCDRFGETPIVEYTVVETVL